MFDRLFVFNGSTYITGSRKRRVEAMRAQSDGLILWIESGSWFFGAQWRIFEIKWEDARFKFDRVDRKHHDEIRRILPSLRFASSICSSFFIDSTDEVFLSLLMEDPDQMIDRILMFRKVRPLDHHYETIIKRLYEKSSAPVYWIEYNNGWEIW